jgi:hypothetical protein
LSNKQSLLAFVEGASGNLGGSGFAETLPRGTQRGIPKVLSVREGNRVLKEVADGEEVGLIKIDVEGHELEVVEGLKQVLVEQSPIVLFESNSAHKGNAVIDRLRGYGYRRFYVPAARSAVGEEDPRAIRIVARLVAPVPGRRRKRS